MIEDEYTWLDWIDACAAWKRTAPPVHIMVKAASDAWFGAPDQATKPLPSVARNSSPEEIAANFGVTFAEGDLPKYQRPAKGFTPKTPVGSA